MDLSRYEPPPSMAPLHRQLGESGRYGLYAVLAASGAVGCALVVFRVWYTDTPELTFLVWNLVLAAIPFALSEWMTLRPVRGGTFAFGVGLWLLFFPNAPYIMTDLLHLFRQTGLIPRWFDLVVLLLFAWNGLMLGFLSLRDMQHLIEERRGWTAGWLFAGAAMLLGSFGIYLGRVLRWNSWDLFTRPGALLSDVAAHLLHPFEHPTAYGMTLLFATFLLLGYLTLRSMTELGGPAGVASLRRRRG